MATRTAGLLVVFLVGAFYHYIAGLKQRLSEKLHEQEQPLQQASEQLSAAAAARDGHAAAVNQLKLLLDEKFYWMDLIQTIHGVFAKVEADSTQGPGFEQGIWIEDFQPIVPVSAASSTDKRRPGGVPPKTSVSINAGKLEKISISCRAVNLNRSKATANSDFAYKLEAQLKTNNVFVAKGTVLDSVEQVDEKPLTFMFKMTLQLAKPIKLN